MQQDDHDATWWEAQQAQAEQQARSKLDEGNMGWQSGDMLVWVGYTRTWRGGGKALMSCLGGCSCRNTTVDGYHRWVDLHMFAVCCRVWAWQDLGSVTGTSVI